MKTREFSISTDHEGMYNITARLREVIRGAVCKRSCRGVLSARPPVSPSTKTPTRIIAARPAAPVCARRFPDRREFRHAEGNSTAHLKCSYVGPSQTVLIEDGKPPSASGRACISASSTVRAIAATILR